MGKEPVPPPFRPNEARPLPQPPTAQINDDVSAILDDGPPEGETLPVYESTPQSTPARRQAARGEKRRSPVTPFTARSANRSSVATSESSNSPVRTPTYHEKQHNVPSPTRPVLQSPPPAYLAEQNNVVDPSPIAQRHTYTFSHASQERLDEVQSEAPESIEPSEMPEETEQYQPDGYERTPLSPTSLYKLDITDGINPRSQATITSLLPLSDEMTLMGTSDGLRVWSRSKGNVVKDLWRGLGVWNMHFLRPDTSLNDPTRGSVLVHCGGIPDGATGRPKKDAEVRIYKLQALYKLANWAMEQFQYDGVDLTPSRKGKEKVLSFGGFGKKDTKTLTPLKISRIVEDEPRAWISEYTTLHSSPSSVLHTSLLITPSDINIALSTPNSVVVYTGTSTPTGSYALAMPKTYYVPFSPTTISFVEMEIRGSYPDPMDDTGSSLFEWDDTESSMELGDGVMGRTMGIFVTFTGAKGCVIRMADSGVVELKKGGRGEWLPVQKVKAGESEVYVFTRGSETFLFPCPLSAPLAMQVPVAEVVWPEIPITVHASPGNISDIQLLGVTATGTLHVIELTGSSSGIQKDWASVPGVCGQAPRFVNSDHEQIINIASRENNTSGYKITQLQKS